MIRKIIQIDKQKCNGCGLCVSACHEGAIGMDGGKANLLRDDYCDGLGDCLPVCPTGAITFEEREAAPYDEAAVQARMKGRIQEKVLVGSVCPGSKAHAIPRSVSYCMENTSVSGKNITSQLAQWPVQIKLVPVAAPYFENAHLLIAADCAAYAYGNFHNEFMQNKITLIGCPKLDEGDYSDKLSAILKNNDIKSITIVRMEVPCCRGLASAVEKAISISGKTIPWRVVIITAAGDIWEI